MALTRKFLSAMGLDADKVDEIVAAHMETVDDIKADRDKLKIELDSQKQLAAQLDEAKAEASRLTSENQQLKTDAKDAAKVQAAFDAYKQQVDTEKTNAAKQSALRSALREAGVQRDGFVKLLENHIGLEAITLKDGKVENLDAILQPLKTEFADCFGQVQAVGTPHVTPPSGGGEMTKEAFKKLKLHEKMQYANEHPQEYKNLR